MVRTTIISAVSLLMLSSSAFAAKFELDKAHANVEFRVRHLMVSTVKGVFNKADASFEYDDKAKKVKDLDVTIDATSIDTNNAKRDEHLNSPDFFDTAKHATLTFKAKEFSAEPGKSLTIKGDLTMKGTTKPVTLTGKFIGATKGMDGRPKVGFELKGKINRKDWGLSWNKALEAGGVVVGEEVEIAIDAEADQAAAPATKK